MRREISIIVAAMLFIFVGYLAYSGSIIFPEYWTALAVALTVSALGILYWGFKPRIDKSLKNKTDIQESKTEIAPSVELEKRKSELLPDSRHITKLNIDDDLLDRIYEQARRTAIDLYPDAQLSRFAILVIPFVRLGVPVAIFLDFYSKWADKVCRFQFSELSNQVKHNLPDKSPRSSDKIVFRTLPWKASPQWMQFLHRAYIKIRPLPSEEGTQYHLSATSPLSWSLRFEDGLSGKEYRFTWDGKGLDEDSIKQSS